MHILDTFLHAFIFTLEKRQLEDAKTRVYHHQAFKKLRCLGLLRSEMDVKSKSA